MATPSRSLGRWADSPPRPHPASRARAAAVLAVGLLVALAVECHPGAQEEFDFMDGTRPNRQFSRNSFLPPVDITGARLDVHDRQFCGQSYVATGTVQVCDKSPKAALELLRSHRSLETGKTILQHLASTQESVMFALSHAPGFLDDDSLAASWAGSNWTYRMHFLDKPSAREFGDFMKNEVVRDLAEQNSLSCATALPSEPVMVPSSDTLGYSARVRVSLCGAEHSRTAAAAAQEVVQHLLGSYPSLVYPTTATQVLTNAYERLTETSCMDSSLCCCRKPLVLEFGVSFLSSEDAVRFDRYLMEVGGDALRPPAASCEFCSTVEDVAWLEGSDLSTASLDMLICSPLSMDEVIWAIRDADPTGANQTPMDYAKEAFPSIRAPLSNGALISHENVRSVGRACGDEEGEFCCSGALVWNVAASFADSEDARRFIHFISSDLTAHIIGAGSLGSGGMSFILPTKKSISSWHEHCPSAEDLAMAANEGHAKDAMRWLAETQQAHFNPHAADARKPLTTFPSHRLKLGLELEPEQAGAENRTKDASPRSVPGGRRRGGWLGELLPLFGST